MSVSHLDMFYDTRFSIHVNESRPSNSPNTELTSVPKEAEIRYDDHETRQVEPDDLEAPKTDGFDVAQFLISRAMLDPDATVVPQ